MATLYENYITGDDNWHIIFSSGWYAQTFTPSVNHVISSVKLLIFRLGSPGVLTVSIRATSGGLPTGADLATGTTDGDTLTADSAGEWREITFAVGASLLASTKYAIVCRQSGTPGGNYVGWRSDGSSPTYADGALCTSGDSGASWLEGSGDDEMFEEWGDITGGSTVTTEACTNTIATSTTGWGHITVVGDGAPTQHGHVWSTSQDPTTSDSKTELGAKPQTGNFTSDITDLTPSTTYYIKAYAINVTGTSYGSQVSIVTGSTIQRAHIWSEGSDFHYFDEAGVERVLQGHETASDKDIWPWLDPFS